MGPLSAGAVISSNGGLEARTALCCSVRCETGHSAGFAPGHSAARHSLRVSGGAHRNGGCRRSCCIRGALTPKPREGARGGRTDSSVHKSSHTHTSHRSQIARPGIHVVPAPCWHAAPAHAAYDDCTRTRRVLRVRTDHMHTQRSLVERISRAKTSTALRADTRAVIQELPCIWSLGCWR